MPVDSSTVQVRSELASLIVDFMLETPDGEGIALDIVELIALRMPSREDYPVAVLGFFVRGNLLGLSRGMVTYPDVLERLTAVARDAPLGDVAVTRTIKSVIGLNE